MDMMQLRRSLLSMIGGGKVKLVETGTYTSTEDVLAQGINISHSLGVVPDFIIVMSDEFTAEASMTNRYIANSYFSKINFKASNLSAPYVAWYVTNFATRDVFSQSYEQLSTAKFMDASSFKIPYYTSSDRLKAGLTYHYVVGTYE